MDQSSVKDQIHQRKCFSSLIAFSVSSFNTTSTPAIRDHCSCFNPLISDVETL